MAPIIDASHQVLLQDWPLLLIGSVAAYLVYNLYFHPLARVPGPLYARLGLPGLRTWEFFFRRIGFEAHAQHERYGPVVRVGPNFVRVADPAAVHRIYSYIGEYRKGKSYAATNAFKPHNTMFSETDPHKHAVHRKAASPVYSMHSIVALEEFVNDTISLLVTRFRGLIKENATGSADINLTQWMKCYAGDAVGELAYGSNFNHIENGNDPAHLLRTASIRGWVAGVSGTIPALAPLITKVLVNVYGFDWYLLANETKKKVVSRFDDISSFYDDDGTPFRRDMLAGFMATKSPVTKKKSSMTEVVLQSAAVLGAGSDTTATGLGAFFFFVLQNPEVYARVQEEVDEAFESGVLQTPVRYADATHLTYLSVCLKEAMRLIPSAGADMPRVVSEEGLIVGDLFLPKDTVVAASAWAFHRSEAVFGDDAKVFRPERWLHLSETDRAAMEKNFLTFGAGPTSCLGKNIALMEITKLLPALLRSFDFKIVPRTSSSVHEHRSGRDLDGHERADAVSRIESHLFSELTDFWVSVSNRGEDYF